jgi:hypothetical protein
MAPVIDNLQDHSPLAASQTSKTDIVKSMKVLLTGNAPHLRNENAQTDFRLADYRATNCRIYTIFRPAPCGLGDASLMVAAALRDSPWNDGD